MGGGLAWEGGGGLGGDSVNKSPTCWKNIGIPSKVLGNVLAKCFPKKAGIAATLAFLLISVADPDHVDADPDFLSQIRKNADPDHQVDKNPDFHSQIRNAAVSDHHVDEIQISTVK